MLTLDRSSTEAVYLGDSSIVEVAGKGKVLLKFTSSKSLALHSILMFLTCDEI